jgi:hypothetical protein
MEMLRNESVGPVRFTCAASVLSVGLESALKQAEARIYRGQEPLMDAPSIIFYSFEEGEGVATEVRYLGTSAPGAAVMVFGPSADVSLARTATRVAASGLAHAGMLPEQIAGTIEKAHNGEECCPGSCSSNWWPRW